MDYKLLNLKYVVCVCVGIFCLIYFMAVYLCLFLDLIITTLRARSHVTMTILFTSIAVIRMGTEPIQNEVFDEGKTCHGFLL